MELEVLRMELDALNEEIIALLAKRRAVTKRVALLKQKENLPIYDGKRERIQANRVRELAKMYSLDPDVVDELFTMYVAYCRQEMSQNCL